MSLQESVNKTLQEREKLNLGEIFTHLTALNTGAWNDVLDKQSCGYYQFLSALMRVLKPKQVVELGGAMGVGTLMMLATAPLTTKIYSITLPEGGLEFSFIKREYPNLTKVLGNDLDLAVWPELTVLDDTSFWFIDTEHTEEQLRKELQTYSPFFKRGTVIAMDDIHLNDGMDKVWKSLPYEKIDLTNYCHWSGWGLCRV